jgi:hypothetical protein
MSDVNWVGELTACQLLLKEKYQKSITNFKNIGKQIASAQKGWTDAPSNSPTALIALYKTVNASKSELEGARIEINSAKAYLQSFLSWSHVLITASRVYKDALSCQNTYKHEVFKVEADNIFEKILDNLNKKRLESLANHEIFNAQLQGLQSKIDAWLRDRRDLFMQIKIGFENSIRDLGIGQFNIRVNFDPFDPETSREDLYDEVVEKIRDKIHEFEQEFSRYSTEVLFAERVFSSDVSTAKQQLHSTKENIDKAKSMVTVDYVKDPSSYNTLCNEISVLRNLLLKIGESVHGVLEKRPISSDEDVILNMFQDPRGTDLSTLIVQRLSLEGELFSLDALLKIVVDLFKKNQIIIRIEKRR